MPSLRLDCKGCQRPKAGKEPAKRAEQGFTIAVDHNCKSRPKNHSGPSKQIPAPETGDAEPELQDPRKDLQSPAYLHKGISVQCGNTRGLLQLCCIYKNVVRTHRNVPWKKPQRSSPAGSRWPRYKDEEGNCSWGFLKKPRHPESEMSAWAWRCLINRTLLWVGR